MLRHIRRNILKHRLGHNRIGMEWYKIQIKKFGGDAPYCAMLDKKQKRYKYRKGRGRRN